jgi:cell division protein FtsX
VSRFFFLVREALTNLKRNLLVVAGAVLAVFISLSLAFGALVVNEVLRVNTLAWQDGVHVIAFLNDENSAGVPAGAHQTLIDEVQTWDEVQTVEYFDKNDAWIEYQRIFESTPVVCVPAHRHRCHGDLVIRYADHSHNSGAPGASGFLRQDHA